PPQSINRVRPAGICNSWRGPGLSVRSWFLVGVLIRLGFDPDVHAVVARSRRALDALFADVVDELGPADLMVAIRQPRIIRQTNRPVIHVVYDLVRATASDFRGVRPFLLEFRRIPDGSRFRYVLVSKLDDGLIGLEASVLLAVDAHVA